MKTQTAKLIGALIAAAIIGAAFFFWQSQRQPAEDHFAPSGPLVAPGQEVTKYDPSSPLVKRLAESTDLYALYRELETKDDGESLFLATQIILSCTPVRLQGLQPVVAGYQASVHANDPNRQARLAAIDKLTQRCAGFDPQRNDPVTVRAHEDLMAQAAARSYLPAMLIEKVRKASQQASVAAGSDASWIIEVLESGDPIAMNQAAAQISGLPNGYVMSGKPLDRSESENAWFAWRLVVCDHGFPCEHEPKLMICAFEGICDAASYADAVRQKLGPAKFAQLETYKREIAGALEKRDYASLGLPAR